MSVAIPQEVSAEMTTIEREVHGGHSTLTAAEFREALEARTATEFGLSVDEFAARLQAGELDADSVVVADIAALVRMLGRAEASHKIEGHARRPWILRRLFR